MKISKIIFYNMILFTLGVMVLELFLGGWCSDKNKMLNLGVIKDIDLSFDVTGLYSKEERKIRYSRDKFGIRGSRVKNNPQLISILTVGGSTTDQRYIDDHETWQEVLEDKLKNAGVQLPIGNAGIDGQSSVGHLKNYDLWFPYIPKLKPKYIFYYIGINDFYRIVRKLPNDYSEDTNITIRIKNFSALYNLFRKFRGIFEARKAGINHTYINISEMKYISVLKSSAELEEYLEKMKEYSTLVQALAKKAEGMGAEPVFITQPSLGYRLQNGKLEGVEYLWEFNGKYYSGLDYYQLYKELNRSIRKSATGYKVIDTTDLGIWNDKDFYDFYHMTPVGAKKLGLEIARQFLELLNRESGKN